MVFRLIEPAAFVKEGEGREERVVESGARKRTPWVHVTRQI